MWQHRVRLRSLALGLPSGITARAGGLVVRYWVDSLLAAPRTFTAS